MFASPLVLAAAIFAPLIAIHPDVPGDAGQVRTYRVQQAVQLDEIPRDAQRIQWWVSIPDNERHQELLDISVVDAPGPWRIERDAERGNCFLYVEVEKPGKDALQVVVDFTLRREPVWVQVDPARVGILSDLHRQLYREEVRKDAPHMQVTAQIEELAARVCADDANPATQVKKLLAHVAENADHYSKDPTKPNCGVGDAENCLSNGGGCCTDLHSLFIALARARGIPARLQMGYRLLPKNLGKLVDPGYRCWVEYFLPGYGWVSADIVEADATDGLGPTRWFTGLTEHRLWLNEGREFRLRPEPTQGGPVNTMIIGYAEIDGRPARVLPEGELKPQLSRKIHFVELDEAKR